MSEHDAKKQGKLVEKFVFDQLKGLMETHPCYVHRFVDTHDSGRFVAPQPCDILFASKMIGTIYVEVKSSTVHHSMINCAKSMFSPQQVGKMRLLHRAGQMILCIFYSSLTDKFEIWHMNDCFNDINKKAKLRKEACVAVLAPEDLAIHMAKDLLPEGKK